MCVWRLELATCESDYISFETTRSDSCRYALAADIQTIPGLPTAPGYLNVDLDPETGEIDGLF